DQLIRDVARRELTLRSLAPERRLALEMAVDERAEVTELERQWRDAEELADIADGQLSTTTELEEELRRLKKRPEGDQPSSRHVGFCPPSGSAISRILMATTLTHLATRIPPWRKVPAPGRPNYAEPSHLMRHRERPTLS